MHHATRSPRRVPSPSIPICILLLILATALAPPARATPVATLIPTTPAIWASAGGIADEELGTSVAAAGDVNGDGFGDVIVGAPGWGPATYDWWGRALVFLGGRDGLSPSPAWSILGTHGEGGLGLSVGGAGDVNGDGFADVIIGEYGFSGGMPHRGRAWVVPGSRNGPRTNQAWVIAGDSANAYLGEIVAGAGDVNGDGYDDVLIGGSTRMALYLGRPSGLEKQPAWVGPVAYGAAGIGDVNGDGFGDFALFGGPQTLVYLGSPRGPSTVPDWTGPGVLSLAGKGDVDGDGYGDLVLGPSNISDSVVQVYRGSAGGLSSTPVWEVREPGLPRYFDGIGIAIAGDVNRDGYSDLLVSAPNHLESMQRQPTVFLHLGGPAGPSASPDWRGVPPAVDYSSMSFGWSVALGADVNGDGASEILVGHPQYGQDAVFSSGEALLYAPGQGLPAPVIVHEPVYSAPEGAPVQLEATVSDQTHSVAKVEIVFRWVEDLEAQLPLAMTRASGDLFQGTIPVNPSWSAGLVYSIRATDDYGLVRETIPVGLDYVETTGRSTLALRVESDKPGHPSGIAFTTSRPGPARVRVFDVQGRLLATILDEARLPTGRHTASLRTMRSSAAGVYFFRVETAEGTKSGRIAILR